MANEKTSLKNKIDGTVRNTFGAAWDNLFNPHTEENLRAQYPSAYTGPKPGLPDMVKAEYDAALRATGKKIWRGITQVAASGFGKGVLLTAAIVLAGAAIAFGFGAFSGTLMVPSIAGLLPATVGQGVGLGIIEGANLLLGSTTGLMTLAVGGTLGAITDVRRHQNRMTAEMAKAEAMEYDRIRELKTLQELELAKSTPSMNKVAESAAVPNNGFAAREAQRRNTEPPTQQLG